MAVYAPNRPVIVPRVWIGCLACYNEGQLTGHWYDAVDAADVLPSDLHGVPTDHEEMWVMDTENLPISGETDPRTAAKWGAIVEAVDPQWRGAFLAWIDEEGYDDPDDVPDRAGFYELLLGEWPSFDEFAEEIVRDTGMLDGVPDQVSRYFDYESFARDLAYDYVVIDSPSYTVWVFQPQ